MAAGFVSLLLVALLFSADALNFMLDLTAALALIPYFLAAAYALKLTVTRAAALYLKARRERGLRVFTPAEAVRFGVIVLGAVAGVVSLATGAIEI
jgi:arginine:ornithine antiporter/lysine permease